MLLVELKMCDQIDEEFSSDPDSEFGPTAKFRKFYGNYCGPGNCGGDPTDAVDAACMRHDMCYHKNGKWNTECDKKFIEELDELLKTSLTFKQRTAAQMMRTYFKTSIAQASKKEKEAEAAFQRNKDAFGMNS